MNKVYQVIWSRVRHCYMAVAETVARSHYKHSSKSAAKATWAAVAAAGLLTGIPACSMAQGSTIAATNQVVQAVEGRVLTKDNGKAKKAETPVLFNKELKKLTDRVPFPMNFMVTDGGTDGVYVTEQRYNNDLKGEHIALGEGSVAFDQQKGYSGLFAAGINAVAGGKDAIAIGNQASATGNNFSIAIGSNAEAPMSNSIALGEGSIANLTLSQQGKQSYLTKEDWNGDYNGVLSLGRDLSGARAEVTRRIIHVAGGAADTDAVNVKQLKALEAKIPKAVDLSKYTTTDKLGAVIEQKLGDTYAKKADIPAAKTFKAVGDGISVTEKDNVITYTLDTSKLPQSSTGVYVTEQRYNNDLKGEHIALGEGSVAFDQQKGYSGLFAAGINAVAGGKDAIAIGNQASATGNNFSIAIGSNAEAPMSNSIALGEGSIANLTLSQQGKQSYLTKEDWNGDYNGVLSLGRDLSGARAEVTRRIIHVAGGAADTDAVNVKQLKALEAKIPAAVDLSKYTTTDKLGAVIEQKLGDTYAKKADIPKAVDLSKYTPTDQLGTVIEQKLGDTYAKKADIPAAKTFKAVGDGISVTEKDNVITYTLDTSKLKTQLSGSSSGGFNSIGVYSGGVIQGNEYKPGTVTRELSSNEFRLDFGAGLQAKQVTKDGQQYTLVSIDETVLKTASSKGKEGTNGVTAAQLEQVSQGMQTHMAVLGKRMNSMGAGNAALAALHPMEFDPDDKLEAAVGVGHYGDANAAALGMFYHPDENTLISVGGAFGKDKNVMNAGISFRIGKGGNGMLLTKTALATAVKQQNIVIHQQEERIRQLERENKARDAKLAEVLQALAQVKR